MAKSTKPDAQSFLQSYLAMERAPPAPVQSATLHSHQFYSKGVLDFLVGMLVGIVIGIILASYI